MNKQRKTLQFQRCGANLACLNAATILVHLPQGSTYFCDYHAGRVGTQAAQSPTQRTCGYLGDEPCCKPAAREIHLGDLTMYLCEPHLAKIIAEVAEHLKEVEG